MSYIGTRTFTSQRGTLFMRGQKISWLRWRFLKDIDKNSFVPEEFYTTPEKEFAQQETKKVEDGYDKWRKKTYPEQVSTPSSRDFIPIEDDSPIGKVRGNWDHHPHESFDHPLVDTIPIPDPVILMEEPIEEIGVLLDSSESMEPEVPVIQMFPVDNDAQDDKPVLDWSESIRSDSTRDDDPSYSEPSSSPSNHSSYDSGSNTDSGDSSNSYSDSSSNTSSSDY